jgi:hypothetical protein
MANEKDRRVTLDEVASARMHFAEAQRRLKARAPLEWAIGGCLFAVAFTGGIWLVRPSTPLAIYILVAVTAFLVSAAAVFLNGIARDKWYKAKTAELDSVEERVRSGERMP